jgi:hypothetical protein
MTFIFPSSFNPCVLYLKKDKNVKYNILYIQSTFDTMYIELVLKDSLYENNGSIFYCDFIQAKDGGFPFLLFKDISMLKGETVIGDYTKRLSIINDITCLSNKLDEFRIKSPTLFPVEQIEHVVETINPNFYGIVNGIEFTTDVEKSTKSLDIGGGGGGGDVKECIMRKTQQSDVYELFKLSNGVEILCENNLAYIPTLELSKKLASIFKKKNSIKVSCEYNKDRRKWKPILD